MVERDVPLRVDHGVDDRGCAGVAARLAGVDDPHPPAGVGGPLGLEAIDRNPDDWPRVEIVLNHVGASAALVDVLLAQRVAGLIAAGTGNGTLSAALEAGLRRAARSGVRVLRASRCADGPVLGGDDVELVGAGVLSAVQARVELLLQLLAAMRAGNA